MSKAWSWRHAILKSELSPTTRHVLLTLGCHMTDAGDSAFPSQRTIADETGLGVNTVNKHLMIAKDAGWVSVQKLGMAGKKWKLNSYVATWPKGVSLKGSREEQGVSPNDEGVSPNDIKVFHQMDTNISYNIPSKGSIKNTTQKRRSKIKPDWIPDKLQEKTLAKITNLTDEDIENETDKFKDYHTAKGTLSFNWNANFRTWITNAAKWKREANAKQASTTDRITSIGERRRKIRARVIAQSGSGGLS